MKTNNLELEKLEKRYFDFISLYLKQDCNSLTKELGYLIADKKDVELFFHYLLKSTFKYPRTWLNFETPDAFIHIEVKILQAGKGGWDKATDIRYKYVEEPHFVLLSKRDNREIFRIEVLVLDKNFSVKKLTGKDLSITPYKRT